MNLFHLRYFMKLAEEQHYTRAAEKLCITQPSLSYGCLKKKADAYALRSWDVNSTSV